ncbi:hypothetical protein L1887_21893 [Cichorium endivia]|nr:hypothetical protein L1887_21893 [Cichorium endivia]
MVCGDKQMVYSGETHLLKITIPVAFGRVLISTECPKVVKNLSYGRLCVQRIIHDYLEVNWRDKAFVVRLLEYGDWTPPGCKDDESDSDSNIDPSDEKSMDEEMGNSGDQEGEEDKYDFSRVLET